MPLNTTDEERESRADAELALKLSLEQRQITELRELFRNMSEDMEAFVAETGQAPRAAIYEDDLRGLLARQGRRVSRAFTGDITDFLSEASIEEPIIEELAQIALIGGATVEELVERIRNEVRLANQLFIVDQVATDTKIITDTNQREMDASVSAAFAILAEESTERPSNAAVAILAAQDFQSRAFGRTPTIAATWTQKIAEGSKDNEFNQFFTVRNSLSTVVANVPLANEVRVWITMGDGRVRFAHVLVNGKRSENGVWQVGGESLRFPGDPRGRPSNIINCRCSAQPVIE